MLSPGGVMGGTSSRPPCLLEAGAAHAHPPHPPRVPLALGEHPQPDHSLVWQKPSVLSILRTGRRGHLRAPGPSLAAIPALGEQIHTLGPREQAGCFVSLPPALLPFLQPGFGGHCGWHCPRGNVSPCKGFFWVWLDRCGWEASPEPEKECFPLLWVSSSPAVGTRLGRAVRGVNLTPRAPRRTRRPAEWVGWLALGHGALG